VVDGELPDPRLPIVPGHQIVGTVENVGEGVTSVGAGARVGIPWLGWTCGRCGYCTSGRENLAAHIVCQVALHQGRRVVVSLDEKDRMSGDGIEILHYATFLDRLWSGELFSGDAAASATP